MTAIAIPQPLGVPDWVKWPALGLLAGWLLQFSVIFQTNVIDEGDYFIDCTSGSDAAAGTTQGAAWLTLEHAEGNVAAGDVIWIKGTCPGNTSVNPTFREVLRLTTGASSVSGTAGNVITWKGWPGESNQIGDGTDDDTRFSISINGADYHRFEGLNFVGSVNGCIFITHDFLGNDDSDAVGTEMVGNTFSRCGKGFLVEDAADCAIANGHSAIDTHHLTQDTLIDRNRIDFTGRSVSASVRVDICDPLGNSGNHIYRHDHGMNLKGTGLEVTNNVITNSCCGVGVKMDGFNEKYAPLAAEDFSHLVINNTFGPNISLQPYDGCSGRPVLTSRTAATPKLKYAKFKVENNLYIDPVPVGSISDCEASLFVTTGSRDNIDALATCKNNINTTDTSESQSVCQDHVGAVDWAVGAVANNTLNKIEADLEFIDAAAENYHLGATSFAINAGLDEGDAPTVDFDNDARSGNPDVGAFER